MTHFKFDRLGINRYVMSEEEFTSNIRKGRHKLVNAAAKAILKIRNSNSYLHESAALFRNEVHSIIRNSLPEWVSKFERGVVFSRLIDRGSIVKVGNGLYSPGRKVVDSDDNITVITSTYFGTYEIQKSALMKQKIQFRLNNELEDYFIFNSRDLPGFNYLRINVIGSDWNVNIKKVRGYIGNSIVNDKWSTEEYDRVKHLYPSGNNHENVQ
jgi:hypothetical protein